MNLDKINCPKCGKTLYVNLKDNSRIGCQYCKSSILLKEEKPQEYVYNFQQNIPSNQPIYNPQNDVMHEVRKQANDAIVAIVGMMVLLIILILTFAMVYFGYIRK